jgi:hypothetical protein
MPIDCEKLYPQKLTSDTVYVDTTGGNNTDYTDYIDSLRFKVDSYLDRILVDSVLNELSIIACIDAIKSKDSEVRKISKEFNDLKAKYKPCLPTFIDRIIEKTVEDTRVTSQLKNEIATKNSIINERDKSISEKDKKIGSMTDSWWRTVALISIGIILLTLIFRFAIIKRPL